MEENNKVNISVEKKKKQFPLFTIILIIIIIGLLVLLGYTNKEKIFNGKSTNVGNDSEIKINITDNKDYEIYNTISKEINLNGDKHILTIKIYTDKGHAHFSAGTLDDKVFNVQLEEIYLDNTLINNIRVTECTISSISGKANIDYKIIKGVDNNNYLALITPEIYDENVYEYLEDEEFKDAKTFNVGLNNVVNIFNDNGEEVYSGIPYTINNQVIKFYDNTYQDGILVNFYDNYITSVSANVDGIVKEFKYTINNNKATVNYVKTYSKSEVLIEGLTY